MFLPKTGGEKRAQASPYPVGNGLPQPLLCPSRRSGLGAHVHTYLARFSFLKPLGRLGCGCPYCQTTELALDFCHRPSGWGFSSKWERPSWNGPRFRAEELALAAAGRALGLGCCTETWELLCPWVRLRRGHLAPS